VPDRALILGTAGHIDHGKTALVRALTGVDTDRLPQEKERGITIDIGFAALDLDGTRLGIVDVPGHERFIRNMLAGASGIDVAMLVIAADDSVMPQTREHLAILRLLGVRHGLVALTKTDLAEDSWLDLVEEDIATLVRGTFLAGAPIVRTSATTGAGIDELRAALVAVSAAVTRETEQDAFRLAVDRSFVQSGVGTVVTGTVSAGRLEAGATVELLPAGDAVRVRGLQVHGRAVDAVTRGQRAAVNLMGVHHSAVRRGHEIAAPGALRPTRLLTAHVEVLPESPWPLRHRHRLRLHLGTQEVMARLDLLEGTAVEPGAETLAQLTLAEPGVAVAGQPFVLRSESPLLTVGGGRVLQPCPRRIARRDAAARERLAALRSDDATTRADAALYFLGAREWSGLDLARDAGVPSGRVDGLIAAAEDAGTLETIPAPAGRVVRIHRDVRHDLETRIVDAARALHERAPLESVIPRARLRQAFRRREDETVLGLVIDGLIAAGRLTGDEGGVALAEFEPALTAGQRSLQDEIVTRYRDAGFSPPLFGDLERPARTTDAELRTILDLAVRGGHLVHLGGGFFLHRDTEEELRRRLTERLRASPGLTMSEIRDVLGTSRKYALPMCEYLDRIGVTRRKDDLRVLAQS
jgi:selenocysteine-specific elongation factor